MTRNLKVGLIGYGAMGQNHARVLSNIQGVDFLVICDSNEIESSKHAGIPRVATLGEIEKYNLDYCVLATPTSTHEMLSIELSKMGINFLIEKPLSLSVQTAINIDLIAQGNGIKAAVGQIERYNSALIQARERIHSGEIGEIYQISTRRQGPFPSRISDVGVVFDLATHDIDLTSWIAKSSYTHVSAFASKKSDHINEDLVTVNGALSSGVIVNHVVNWLSPLKERKVIITGEKGTFVVDTLRSDLTLYENGVFESSQESITHFRGVTLGEVRVFGFHKPEPLMTEHEAFRDFINGVAQNTVSLKEGIETIRIAEKILESALDRKVVKI